MNHPVDPIRSALRKAEAWRRTNPQADAHVRLYFNLFSKSKRSTWCCPFCAREIRKMDRPKNVDGHSKRHCGCKVERLTDRSLPVAARYKPARIARRRRKCEELGDEYIRKLLIGKWIPGQKTVDFPQPLIDLKREVVRIERFIRKKKEAAK